MNVMLIMIGYLLLMKRSSVVFGMSKLDYFF